MAVQATVDIELLTTPATLAGLSPSAWFRAHDIENHIDGDEVKRWPDASGNGRDLTAPDLGPLFYTNQRVGLPSIRHDGTARYLQRAALSDFLGTNGVGTCFFVARADAANAGPFFHHAVSSGARLQCLASGTTATNNDGTDDQATKSGDFRNVWAVFMWRHDATNVKCGLSPAGGEDDAALASTATGATASLSSPVYVGRNDTGSSLLVADVVEQVWFSAALTEAQTRQVVRYLAKKYAISDPTGVAWTTLGDVIAAAGIKFRYGMAGTDFADRVAATGQLSFVLDNSVVNAAGLPGYYSPGHANHWAAFDVGAEVRVRVTYGSKVRYKWRGYVDSVAVAPGQYRSGGAWQVRVDCVDWMDVAARAQVSGVPVQVSKRSDEVFAAVLSAVSTQPAGLAVGYGSDTYPYALDNSEEEALSLMTEFQRLAMSELGFVYVRADDAQGGTLVFESRMKRGQHTQPLFALTDQRVLDMEVSYARDDVYNEVLTQIYPRKVDAAATTVLFSLNDKPPLPRNVSQAFICPFRDPGSGGYQRTGGIDMVQPAATTDYTFNAAEDGSGTDLTSQLTVVAVYSANSAEVTVLNNGPQDGFITKLQIRGKGIYTGATVIFQARDVASQTALAKRTQRFDMPYQSEPDIGVDAAFFILNQSRDPVARIRRATFVANEDDAGMVAALDREVSDRVSVSEPVTAVVADYFINAVTWDVSPGGIVRCSWDLVPADAQNYWLLEVDGFTELDETTKLAYGLFAPQWQLDVSQLGVDTVVNP